MFRQYLKLIVSLYTVGLQLETPNQIYQTPFVLIAMYRKQRPMVITAWDITEALRDDPEEEAATTDVVMSEVVQQQAEMQPTSQQVEKSNVRLIHFHKVMSGVYKTSFRYRELVIRLQE